MARKTVSGPVRNKERTKEKLLKSVGKIISTKGFHSLKITNIARTASVDKKLIYNYFGSVENLINQYLRNLDFGSSMNSTEYIEEGLKDNGKTLSKNILKEMYSALSANPELQKIIVWELYEYNDILRELCDHRERLGDEMFQKFMHPHFKENHKKYRAILALLISSTYYLNIHADSNGSKFCGLDIHDKDDREVMACVIDDVIDFAYEKYGLK